MTALRFGSASDTGMVRTVNQDSSLVAEPLFAVADGMGGHAAGEVASQVAVEALRLNAEPSAEGLVHAVRVANRAVWEKAEADPSMRGMGTTLCAVVLVAGSDGAEGGDSVVVANVGDSRVYLFHNGELEQITEDHSLVEDLVREGKLTHAEAKTHPQRNVVTRVLGIEEDVEVDSWHVDPYVGDRLLLCSDGLFNEVDDGPIAGVLRRLEDPQEAAAELVRLANEGGGRDNVTVVVVDVVDDGGRAEAASAGFGARATTLSSRPLPAGPGEEHGDGTSDLPAHTPLGSPTVAPGQPLRSASAATEDPPRRFTWRVVLFALAVLAVLGAAAGAVGWFARSTYYVGVDGDDVAIFQGRPGGVLWFQPTLEVTTDLAFDDVPPARQPDVEAGKQETSLEDARRYVERLKDQAAARTTTTTTTTATTTPETTATSTP
ncbi:MAG: Stp1/IreP family PP2C-type Ser/Thr phosphatase [Acidimicrobiales bacterium]